MKILTYTTLFPNEIQASHGIFVERRLQHLLKLDGIESRVIAPVPWFPFRFETLKQYSKFARVPSAENRSGIEVIHPRYPVIPKIGMIVAPLLLTLATLKAVRKIIKSGYDFDLIDAHYFYPDGIAAAALGKALNKKLTITARGTDINLIPKYALPRKMIVWAAGCADGIITVCEALKDELVNMGVDETKIKVLRNGVDLEVFHPMDRQEMRKKLNIKRPTLLSAGYLVERKGHHIAIQAMKELPEYELLIAGDGEMSNRLMDLANKIGVRDRIRFLGALSQKELVEVYSAVDALVLASDREGMANVLLESMACGTPVVATNIWGTPEVVKEPQAGVLMEARTAEAIVAAVNRLAKSNYSRQDTRKYAEKFSWDDTVTSIHHLFQRILSRL